MNLANRPHALDPYDSLPHVPSFTLTSEDLADEAPMPEAQTAEGGSVSPQLSWSGFPPETRSFVVTCFDPDAPIPSGWWHWTILDVPVETTSLDRGVGASDLLLDGPAFHVRVDHGEASYHGAQPPAGDRPHRYVFAVHALDVDSLGLDDEATPAQAAFHTLFHTIARARLTVTHRTPA